MPNPITPNEREVIISFSIPARMRDWYRKEAVLNNTSMSAIMRGATRRFSKDPDQDKWKDCR